MQISNEDFVLLADYMLSNFGIDLSKKKALIESRLAVYISKMGFDSFSAFVEHAVNDKSGEVLDILTTKLTTNYTYFMREEEHYSFLTENVLPSLKDSLETKDLRIWSAGCSSGEEAYTVAMTIKEFLGNESSKWDAKVLATDISKAMLGNAEKGLYAASNLEKLPVEWIEKYFIRKEDGNYQIRDVIKNEVIFRTFNLTETFPFRRRFHVIFCRNVMIYFNKQTKIQLVSKFYDHLEEGGYLFIGHSESLNGISDAFTYVKPSIYRKGYING